MTCAATRELTVYNDRSRRSAPWIITCQRFLSISFLPFLFLFLFLPIFLYMWYKARLYRAVENVTQLPRKVNAASSDFFRVEDWNNVKECDKCYCNQVNIMQEKFHRGVYLYETSRSDRVRRYMENMLHKIARAKLLFFFPSARVKIQDTGLRIWFWISISAVSPFLFSLFTSWRLSLYPGVRGRDDLSLTCVRVTRDLSEVKALIMESREKLSCAFRAQKLSSIRKDVLSLRLW